MKRLSALVLLVGAFFVALAPIDAAIDGVALARQRMSFYPGHHAAHRGRPARFARHGGGHRSRLIRHAGRRGPSRHASQNAEGEGAIVSRPGGGFTLENGVLTYPAPARFQPQNLKHK